MVHKIFPHVCISSPYMKLFLILLLKIKRQTTKLLFVAKDYILLLIARIWIFYLEI